MSGRASTARGVAANRQASVAIQTEQQLLEGIAKWTLREAALRDALQKRMAQVDASRREERELRESLRLLTQAFDECRGERYDIVSDFTRQYKATLEELIRVVTTTESTITELKDQQELARIALVETGKERDHFLSLKDREIEEQNKRIQEMDEEFHIMIDEMQRRMEKKVADAVKAAKHPAGAGNGDDDDDEDSATGSEVEGAAAAASGGAAAADDDDDDM